MSKVALSGNASGTGTFTIASPNSNVDRTINLPDSNGTILTTATAGVPVNGPAFSAYLPTTTQAVTTSTWTRAALSAEDFDLDGSFNSTGSTVGTAPAYSFNPQVAGYYQITGQIGGNSAGVQTAIGAAIYKNGSAVTQNVIALTSASSFNNCGMTTSKLVYLNGSTDYIQLYGYVASTNSPRFDNGFQITFLTGALIRSAT